MFNIMSLGNVMQILNQVVMHDQKMMDMAEEEKKEIKVGSRIK